MKTLTQYAIVGGKASEIAASLEDGIRAGRIPQGALLPTVRALAAALQVSPTTVTAAYRTLRLRGALSAQRRRGTRVSPRPPLVIRPAAEIPRHLRNLAYGNPDPALLPRLRPVIAQLDLRPHLYGEPTNRAQLLERAAQQFEADQIPATSLAVMGGH